MSTVEIHPATSWDDVVQVFGPNGAQGGCWCMWFRATNNEFRSWPKEERRDRLRDLIESGDPAPGLVGYLDDTPAGWVAVAPREDYPRLARSAVTKPLDLSEPGVWSVTCFYVTRAGRGHGLPAALLAAAVDYARTAGARALEGYPADAARKLQAGELYHGWPSLFTGAGFTEVARPSPARPVMRRTL
ncbi:GNAT family N-acetyltransferase [Nonomuraea typhae]|uniref:GNAT family N-acetyltransferase n=1 Tax=Nonomuraea typhae TaxID=2603600 RepID=UPI0012FA76A4|nr:GNAT family N-acetyltransferase [Nonomuraea typhae]